MNLLHSAPDMQTKIALTKTSRPLELLLTWKNMSLLLMLVGVSNFLSHTFFNPNLNSVWGKSAKKENLYLLDKAEVYVEDATLFAEKVRMLANRLEVEPEWLMSVMHAESKFNPAVPNARGSGAVGLIQFMPETARTLGTSTELLKNMTPTEQLLYVEKYMNLVRSKYGNLNNLTQVYLAILFPKALSGDECFVLYAKPSAQYKQNAILDENGDGSVTVGDIDKRMQRLYPKAYMLRKGRGEGVD